MNICFIGCVQFSASALATLFSLEGKQICKVTAVVSKKESNYNTDHVDLQETVRQHSRPDSICHYYESQEELAAIIKRSEADVVYCFGWSSLLADKVLSTAALGVIGFHPAALPANRGRHPIIWALALGLHETASTFFRMDSGPDSGPILSQKKVLITPEDDAGTLYTKITDAAIQQITEFTTQLASGKAVFRAQDDTLASYWRKRSIKDGIIDWRMSADTLHNLIRALSPPYPGAIFLDKQNQSVTAWKSQVHDEPVPQNIEPGKVLIKKQNQLLIKCAGNTALWVTSMEPEPLIDQGDYL